VNLGYNARTCLKNTQNQIGIWAPNLVSVLGFTMVLLNPLVLGDYFVDFLYIHLPANADSFISSFVIYALLQWLELSALNKSSWE
jgi:hypothetical protein